MSFYIHSYTKRNRPVMNEVIALFHENWATIISVVLAEVVPSLAQTNLFILCFCNEVFLFEYFRIWGRLSINSILNLNLWQNSSIHLKENFSILVLNSAGVISSSTVFIPLAYRIFSAHISYFGGIDLNSSHR